VTRFFEEWNRLEELKGSVKARNYKNVTKGELKDLSKLVRMDAWYRGTLGPLIKAAKATKNVETQKRYWMQIVNGARRAMGEKPYSNVSLMQ